MQPTVYDGDIITIDTTASYGIGDILVFQVGQKLYIKRLTAICGNLLWFESDNKSIATMDSNAFGWIDKKYVMGVKV